MSLDDYRAVMETNLRSAFLVTHDFAEGMVTRGSGSIFFIASVASKQAYATSGAYCVAKHGLLGLARSVRQTTMSAGLRVTAIMPGATDTPSWQDSGHPAERFMPAEDIASTLLNIYKLSDRSVVEEIILRPTLGDL